jgi:PKD repeat protein
MKVKITLLLLSLCVSFISIAGNGKSLPVVNRGEVIERLWIVNEKAWEKSMVKALNTTEEDFKVFLKFYSAQFAKSRSNFISKGLRGEITEGNAMEYFARLTDTYKALYHKFEKIKKDYPNTVNEYTADKPVTRPPVVTGACNPGCNNLDFSSGNLSGWNAYYAANDLSLPNSFGTTAPTGGPAGAVTKAANDPSTFTNQVTIMSGAGVDPYAGALIPVAAPLGSYSARVGDTTTGFGVGILTNQFVVPSVPIPVLTIQYAVVLEHTVFHSFYQQPWFQVQVLDASGNPIPGCGQYFVVAFDTLNYLKNFVAFPHPVNSDTMYCRPWTSVFVPLNGYQGQCISLSFEASDCNGGAHLGYAYVAASCNQLQVTSSSTTFCGQSTITLTAPPGGTYQWIGPCISGSTTNQTATVTCAGTYSVIVSSSTTGTTCVDTLSMTVTTSPGKPPVPFFKTDTVCAGTPTIFNNLSNPIGGAGVKFYWDFFNNGKFEDSTTSPSWTFTQGGVYFVRLHETVNGCGMDTTLKVIVDSTSTLSFSAFSSCAGQASSFFMSGAPSSKFIWNFGDPSSGVNDTSTLLFPSHIFTSAGTYTVALKTLGVHCADSSTQTITVGATPIADIWSGQTSCADSVIKFKDKDSINIFEYEWEFYNSSGTFIGFNFSTSSATTTFTFPGPGTYSVILYAFSNPSFCEGGDTIKITIGSAPTAAFNILPSDSACIHRPIQCVDASKGAPSSWSWNFGDPASGVNNMSNKQNPTHIYSSAGNYIIKLIDNPGAGCTDSITDTVAVTEVASNFNVNTVCLHDTTKFGDLSSVTNGNIKIWQWNFGDGNTSTLRNPSHVYAVAGTYNVTLTVTSTTGCDQL